MVVSSASVPFCSSLGLGGELNSAAEGDNAVGPPIMRTSRRQHNRLVNNDWPAGQSRCSQFARAVVIVTFPRGRLSRESGTEPTLHRLPLDNDLAPSCDQRNSRSYPGSWSMAPGWRGSLARGAASWAVPLVSMLSRRRLPNCVQIPAEPQTRAPATASEPESSIITLQTAGVLAKLRARIHVVLAAPMEGQS
jgi:hypothetical protein